MNITSSARRAVVGLALASSLVLSGCGQSGTPGESAGESAGETLPSSVSSPADSALPFGSTFTYPDGLTLRVDAPVGKERDSSADGTLTDRYTVQVTVTNGTPNRVDLSSVHLAVVGGGQNGTWYASGDEPKAALAPGRSLTFRMEFAVASVEGLSVEVTPTWDRETAVFEAAPAVKSGQS